MTEQKKWYQRSGKDYDVVLSTRVRLARNLRSFPFPNAMNPLQREQVNKLVKEAVENGGSALSGRFKYIELEKLEQYELVSLMERHLVSPEFVREPKGRALMLLDDESVSIMLCEEDHLRIQAMSQGFEPDTVYELADRLDTLLSERLDFAANEKWGYLTACPTNLGTAMRASVMVHLPALEATGALRQVSESIGKMGLTIRGMYGEGSKSSGAIYQISNQETLGVTEKATIEKLGGVIEKIAKLEREARTKLAKNESIQDSIWRAYGILRSARRLSGSEFVDLFSTMRMGAATGVITGLDLDTLGSLFVEAQPATMMLRAGKPLKPDERDARRAEMVRTALTI